MAFNRTIGMLSGDPRGALDPNMYFQRGQQLGQKTGGALAGALGRDTRTPEQMREAKLREAIAAIPKNDPQYMEKVAQVMAELGDPTKAAEMMQTIQRSRASANSPSWAGQGYFKDAKGNLYTASQLRQGTNLKYVMTDVRTGQQVDPANIEGLRPTDSQFQTAEDTAALAAKSRQQQLNQDKAMANYARIEALRANVPVYDRMTELLLSPNPPMVGALWDMFPSFRPATQEFQNLSQQLGLGVISSTTFGALSEGELQLAMDVGRPPISDPKKLAEWIDRKAAAEQVLMGELEFATQMLESGASPGEIIKALRQRPPANIEGLMKTRRGRSTTPPVTKSYTMDQVRQTAAQYPGLTEEDVLADLKSRGIEVIGE